MRNKQSLELIPQLTRALAFCQMIEEALRHYVRTSEELIAVAVPYGVPFRVDKKSIENASLGTLIRMFEKLNRNDSLHARLRELPKHRNHIAHEAFLRAIQGISDTTVDLEYAKKHAQSVGDEAEDIVKILAQELKSILVMFPNSKTALRSGS